MIEIFAGLFYLFTQAEKKIAISGVLIFTNREKKEQFSRVLMFVNSIKRRIFNFFLFNFYILSLF